MKKKSKPVNLFNLDLTLFGEYNSITDAAKSIGCSVKTIYRALQHTEVKIIKQRYIVKFASNKNQTIVTHKYINKLINSFLFVCLYTYTPLVPTCGGIYYVE